VLIRVDRLIYKRLTLLLDSNERLNIARFGLQKVTISGFPKLPRLQALKNSGSTDVAEKVNVDSTAPPGGQLPKPQVRFSEKRAQDHFMFAVSARYFSWECHL